MRQQPMPALPLASRATRAAPRTGHTRRRVAAVGSGHPNVSEGRSLMPPSAVFKHAATHPTTTYEGAPACKQVRFNRPPNHSRR